MPASRDAYVEKLKAQLDEWNARIDLLEAQARRAKAEARLEYVRRVEPVRAKWTEIRNRLKEIQSGAGQSWETLREGIEAAWGELRDGFEEARTILVEGKTKDGLDSPAQLEQGSEPGGGKGETAT